MFCSLEKLKIGMSASLLLGLFLTAHGKWIYGRLDSKYLSSFGKVVNSEECSKKICRNDFLNCRFAHTRSKQCYLIKNLPLRLLLIWSSKTILTDDKNMAIYYFYNDLADIMTEKPKIWWLLDNVSKGRNFGTAGSALDIPMGSVVWSKDAKGPRALSPLLYAEGKKNEKVALMHNGELLLDLGMESIFTISMWVKTAKVNKSMWLLGGYHSDWVATHFEFWPSFERNQLSLSFDGTGASHIYTKKNNTGVDDWRHVAVVHQPGKSPIFFLNGNVWPLEYDHKFIYLRRPTHLQMWRCAGCNEYHGKIACVMVFQAALSRSQIKILKDNCP